MMTWHSHIDKLCILPLHSQNCIKQLSTMAFRGKIIEMIESHVEALKGTKYVITDVMQSNFVGFVNSFLKHHSNYNAVEFKLSSNLLFAQMDNIRIIIASDETKGYCIPGSDNGLHTGVNMREPVEAFILIGDNMCYDSVLMRTFFPNTAAGEDKYEPYIPTPAALPAPPPAAPPAQTNSTNFIFQGSATTEKPATAAPTTNLFAQTPAPTTNLFAQTPTPAPTNLFAQTPAPAPTSLFTQNAPAATTTNLFAPKTTPAAPTTNLFSQTPAFTAPTNTFSQNTASKPATSFFSQPPATTSFSAFSKPATPSLTFGGPVSRQSSFG
ncbi:hypothetical protein ATCVCan0610SP_468L [Acanthocystis turfacea Chlorella virus Can0610SP]|nr:hypothetical protein ATCVCan0610SP_468L [Acanthocystis turfacea Chlorella virus Can0610SP]